ncbi:MAG: response regulator transcription factor [Ornithinimicrobium sp.]|uniref:response regulator transcription factor n=1 Tax=Ornithinimicrobium sp. TaxID=1977084 RepID=UPI0026DFA6C3|nr:response regulator transcription factor [Ornithinimicrobium sp.]MDO5739298.1 response regulator transcription factor [Ornithinimicrobium sp.]
MRVVIVDDQQLMRRGLTMLLGTEDGIEVVGEAGHGREALAVVATSRPDVVLTDAQMPVMGGVELVAELRRVHPELPVIILTTFDDDDLVRRAIAAGAAGFLLKDSSTTDLVHAIKAVADGGLVIDPRVARAALSRPSADQSPARVDTSPLAVLTRAERAVATEVATGATNSEIAATLVIAEGTVKNHVSALLRKLGQRDRTALALLLARYLVPRDMGSSPS